MKLTVTLNVNFPALTELVAYLKSQQQQQDKIDELTSQINQITLKLAESSSSLKLEVNKEH